MIDRRSLLLGSAAAVVGAAAAFPPKREKEHEYKITATGPLHVSVPLGMIAEYQGHKLTAGMWVIYDGDEPRQIGHYLALDS
jgi:hypothetical protein